MQTSLRSECSAMQCNVSSREQPNPDMEMRGRGFEIKERRKWVSFEDEIFYFHLVFAMDAQVMCNKAGFSPLHFPHTQKKKEGQLDIHEKGKA